LLASKFLHYENNLPKEGNFVLENSDQSSPDSDRSAESRIFEGTSKNPLEEYVQLQKRIFMVLIFLSALAVGISAIFFDLLTTGSLLVGSFFGVLYLRLLARNIEKLGTSSQQVGKFQLIIPVLLVFASLKLPQLHLFPALFGFLLYKLSLIIQTIFESFARK